MKYIYGLCLATGVLLVLGIAGGSDCGNFSLAQAAWYTLGSVLLAFVGLGGLISLDEKKEEEG